MFKYRYFQEFSFWTFVLSLLYTHVLDSLIHLMFLKAIFSKMCNPMTPIFISIALTLLLNTKLVTSAAYLTLLLGCLLCITNLIYFNQNSWFFLLLHICPSTNFPLLNKYYWHLFNLLDQILTFSSIPLFSSHSPYNCQQILQVTPSKYPQSLTAYKYHRFYNPVWTTIYYLFPQLFQCFHSWCSPFYLMQSNQNKPLNSKSYHGTLA